ncbi:hypothetical protein E3T24_13805 [Cryobacterium sp. TmT2-59]|uniref:Glycosyl hydrolase n=1 Tax=Cryobacterium shii TaxID=1259235 RepID=A0AAQ2HGK0_9MICO|nr:MULTISPECIES: glycoside hydrolase family 99-like domain-containing protein [Cryobacterium]TFC50492.1 hypothetical protein E3O49_04825 [Cryobacterium shii]TFC82121.1 hypothetical protein E3T24_13805 [Cryobacterium sp. TmT2-59]
MTAQIFAYYFPNWHTDPRSSEWFGKGWTEWDLLRTASPRFPGHRQPRIPALGEFDEADPAAMDTQIDLAVSHGVDGFLFDYYWYEDGPFLQRALDEGFLPAPRCKEVKFALMWANHALVDIFPSRNVDGSGQLLVSGDVGRSAFEEMARHVTDKYFAEDNYLKMGDRPFLSIYDLDTLVTGLGGVEATKDALQWFGSHARTRGHAGIHLDGVVRGQNELPGSTSLGDPRNLLSSLDFDSASSYVWIHHASADEVGFPAADWDHVRDLAFESYERIAGSIGVPFYPNVTVGWDSTPRTDFAIPFELGSYPWIPAADPDPTQFQEAVEEALRFLDRHPTDHPLITINAWNEWTEGSSLLPDTHHGLGYLEALREARHRHSRAEARP